MFQPDQYGPVRSQTRSEMVVRLDADRNTKWSIQTIFPLRDLEWRWILLGLDWFQAWNGWYQVDQLIPIPGLLQPLDLNEVFGWNPPQMPFGFLITDRFRGPFWMDESRLIRKPKCSDQNWNLIWLLGNEPSDLVRLHMDLFRVVNDKNNKR